MARLLTLCNLVVDRTRIRRAVGESVRVFAAGSDLPGIGAISEAGRSLGLTTRLVEAKPADLLGPVYDGSLVLTERNNHFQLTRLHHGRIVVEEFTVDSAVRSDAVRESTRRTTRRAWIRAQMAELARTDEHDARPGSVGRDGNLGAMIVDPQLPLDTGRPVGASAVTDSGGHGGGHGGHDGHDGHGGHHTSHADHPKPLTRLFRMLRPDRSDIVTIFIFSAVIGLLSLSTPIAVEALVDVVSFGRMLQPVLIVSGLLLIFLAAIALFQSLQTLVVELIQRRLFARAAADFAARLPRVRMAEFRHAHGPELLNRFFDVMTTQKALAGLLVEGIQLSLMTVVGMIVLATYNPWLLGFDVVLLALILGGLFLLGRGAVKTSIVESKKKYVVADWLEELTRNPNVFHGPGGYELAVDRGDVVTESWLVARQKHFRILYRQIVFALAVQALASTVLLGLGGYLVISNELSLGQLVAAELIVALIVGSFAKLPKHLEAYYDLLAAVDKLGHVVDLTTERNDGVLSLPVDRAARFTVSAAADSRMTWELAPGETVALQADSRRTFGFVQTIVSPEDNSRYRLQIDSVDLRDVRPDILDRHLAYVSEPEVLGGTVDMNVSLGRFDVIDADVRDALDQVGLLATVERMPQGLESPLISGGREWPIADRAKLTIARALAGSPRLLIIDRTLDLLSEREQWAVLTGLTADREFRTTLVITAQRSVARMCDRLIDLTDGPDSDHQEEHA